jgi:hypothetical protein
MYAYAYRNLIFKAFLRQRVVSLVHHSSRCKTFTLNTTFVFRRHGCRDAAQTTDKISHIEVGLDRMVINTKFKLEQVADQRSTSGMLFGSAANRSMCTSCSDASFPRSLGIVMPALAGIQQHVHERN